MQTLMAACPVECHADVQAALAEVPEVQKASFIDFFKTLINSVGFKAAFAFVRTHIPQIVAAIAAAATGNFGPLGSLIAEALMTPVPAPA